MNPAEKEKVLQHIQDLRLLFKFGSEMVPFVEQLFLFIYDVLPLIDYLSFSMDELTRNMPTARDRLQKVNQTAEAATNQIMDRVESITEGLAKLNSMMDSGEKNGESQQIIRDLQKDTLEITSALQFQDITSQHLESVQRILKAIQQRFTQLREEIDKIHVSEELKNFVAEKEPRMSRFVFSTIDLASVDLIRSSDYAQQDIDRIFEDHEE